MKYQQKFRLDEIRQQQYDYHKDHDRSPYTWFKARLYMEGASVLIWILQWTKLNPTYLTVYYGLLGMIGGVCLAIPDKKHIFTGLIIFYFKGILDWADGHLARIKNQTSQLGKQLDSLCGKIGTVCFYLGVSCFFGNITTPYLILYLFISFFLLKVIGFKIGRACVVDLFIFIVGVTTLLI